MKNESLLGKRVACPSCRGPIVVHDPGQPVAAVVPEPLVQTRQETASTGASIAAAADQSAPRPSAPAAPFLPPAIAGEPNPVRVDVSRSAGPTGLPVIHESPKTSKGTKSPKADKKKNANHRRSSKKLLWVCGLAGAGSFVGLFALFVFLAGPEKKSPDTAKQNKPAFSPGVADNVPPSFDPLPTEPSPIAAIAPAATSQLTELVAAVGDAVVCITVVDQSGQEVALGTGVLFDSSGLLVTNYHVVENAARASVLFRDGRRGEIAGYRAVDAARDLVVLQLAESPEPVPFLRLNPAADVQQGEAIVALGHPAGFTFSLTDGIVSAKRMSRELPAQYQQYLKSPPDQQWIQTTAAISGGNSGGPLLNAKGELVGINTWVAQGENLGFAIHVRHVVDLANALSAEVVALPVKAEPESYQPTHPQIVDLWQQFESEFQQFAVRLQLADSETAGDFYEAYNPTVTYMRRFLEFAETNRGQPAALEALIAVCSLARLAPDSPTLATAAFERLAEDHVNDANLRTALLSAALVRNPSARVFLNRVIETSSNRELQGIATFALASAILSSASSEDDDIQGAKLLERVVQEFADVTWESQPLGAVAERARFAAQYLVIGRTAMDITGNDQQGQELKLSEYRGKVVVLDFWADWCPHCRVMYPHERKLVEEHEGRPFALLGVNCDERDRFQTVSNSGQVTWPSFWDGRGGPIAQHWQVDSYPTIYVLDHQGIIRFKDLRDENLTTAVRLLVNLAEVESLVAQEPGHEPHLVELARCHSDLADAYWSINESRGALEQWRAAVDSYRKLATNNPEDSQYRRRFATALVSLGETAQRSGELGLAAQSYREAGRRMQGAAAAGADAEDRELLLLIVAQLGRAAELQGEYGEAVRQYQAAVKLAPDAATPLNSLAWILATCPDESIRDGDQAVVLATKACELTRWESYYIVDTLAAALAEQGQFDQAVQQQRKAVRLAPPGLQASMNDRVKLYQSQQPYRLNARPVAASSVAVKDNTPTPPEAGRMADQVQSSAAPDTSTAASPPAAATAPPPTTLEQAEQFLRDEGLRLSQSGVTLEDELKLSQSLREIKSERTDLFKADGELRKLLSAEIELKGTIYNLRQQNVVLNNQLSTIDPTNIALNNRLVGALNANISQIELLTEQNEKLGEQIRDSRGKVNAAREIYIQRILDLRKLADSVQDQYEQLGNDANVQAAIQIINDENGKSFVVAASGRFKADERELKKREDKVLADSIPLRRDGGTFIVSALIGGKHAQELVVDSGASLVSLPKEMAAACGIQVKSSDPTIELQLADGRVIEGKLVSISSIRVGKFTVEDVEAVVLGADATAAPALLGMSFLEKFKFEIDAQQGRLTMVEVDISGS